MCGICGHVRACGPDGLRDADPANLEAVLKRLSHRGPNGLGRWRDDTAALGHARLAILDLDPRANQPMHDPKTGNVMVFNGEIYNFRALRADLEKRGERFRTTGDSEVLLALYRVYGEACLDKLRGMFAFAIWNARKRELFLARDRMGKKPLVYFEGPEGLVFASEIQALRAHPACPRAIDPAALDLFLSLGCVPAPQSIFFGLRKLPPGCCATYGREGLRIRRYWEPDFRETLDVSEAEAMDMAWKELTTAVRLRLESDVPLGLLLSGGVDSSLVAAVLADLRPGGVEAFCIGFSERKYDELPQARLVAKTLGITLHHEILPPATLEMLPEAVARYGEPYADDSALPSLALCRMARKHITVALGGDGGDELCCGYPAFRHARAAAAAQAVLHAPPPADARLRALAESDGAFARFLRRAACRLLWPEAKPLLRAEPLLAPLKARLYTQEAAARTAGAHAAWFLPLLRRAFERANTPLERLQYLDDAASLPDDLLVKMDIASMAWGLEVRSPLLDNVLVELFAKFPTRLKARGRETKRLLKRMAETRLPREVLYRRKHGFDLPVREWMAGPMRGFVREAFAQAGPAFTEFIRPQAAREILDEHVRGVNRKNILWRLLVLALWSRTS